MGNGKLCEGCKEIIKQLISGHEVELKLHEACLSGPLLAGSQVRVYVHFFERMKAMVSEQ